MKRVETDFLGSIDIPVDALYGIHSFRAEKNFPYQSAFNINWYKAVGLVKQACYMMVESLHKELSSSEEFSDKKSLLPGEELLSSLIAAASEVASGHHYNSFIVSAINGGAGTSINMNINEIIANVALIKAGRKPGDYSYIDPLEHANIYQSTNDVLPTALKLAAMQLLGELEDSINIQREMLENYESENRHALRIGYTQMQEAVPSSFGKLFSTYSDAFSRDWWRVSKCFERIKTVNLGGGAIGTGMGVPRYFLMHVVQKLQQLSSQPITRAENFADTTANLDSFVEVHAILKAHAVNLEKMLSDIRLLSSDVCGTNALKIPSCQIGSSIMPSKVNPVIPEYVISTAHKVYANDQLISGLAGQGCLELNAYLPVIGDAFLQSIELLISCNKTIADNMLKDMQVFDDRSREELLLSPAITTALIPYTGYHNATALANHMRQNKCNIFEANLALRLLDEQKLKTILSPENLLKPGFSFRDI